MRYIKTIPKLFETYIFLNKSDIKAKIIRKSRENIKLKGNETQHITKKVLRRKPTIF